MIIWPIDNRLPEASRGDLDVSRETISTWGTTRENICAHAVASLSRTGGGADGVIALTVPCIDCSRTTSSSIARRVRAMRSGTEVSSHVTSETERRLHGWPTFWLAAFGAVAVIATSGLLLPACIYLWIKLRKI